MAKTKDGLYCDGCGIEITIQPYLVGQWVYCCQDCASGVACDCAERMDQEEDYRGQYPGAPA